MRTMLRKVVSTLNRSIFVGERYEENLRNIATASVIAMALGFIMTLINLFQKQYVIALSPLLIFFSALISYISVVRFRRREAAIISTISTVVVVLTFDVLYADNGFAYLWTLLVPLVMCYLFSVKVGALITAYFQMLFFTLFYTPMRTHVANHYSVIVMSRFPILFFFHGLLVLYVMYQYHKSVLFELEHTNRLNEEVARQTAVAEERSRRIEQQSFQTIQTLAHAIDAKDPYTKGHSSRVSQYSVRIAQGLGWDEARVNDLRYAALLHDIGKIGVPDSILNNPGRLTEVEYAIIKSHTTMGADILKNGVMIETAEDVALSHHERYDGRGYPRGLRGKAISEEARIVAIADAFDAMSSNRVYRAACNRDHIRHEFIAGRGKQFDPEFSDIFMGLWDRGLLDDILRSDAEASDIGVEASTAQLQQAVEAFVSQNEDVNKLVADIRTSGSYEGALDVDYSQFTKLYEFIDNLGKRFSHPYKLILITLETPKGDTPYLDELERAMFCMEQSIRQTIRNVDIVTRYSRQQFLVILLGADDEGVNIAVDRIFRGYFKMYGNGVFSLAYTVADLETE